MKSLHVGISGTFSIEVFGEEAGLNGPRRSGNSVVGMILKSGPTFEYHS